MACRAGQIVRMTIAGVMGGACVPAHADLTDPLILNQLQPLERIAAVVNQSVYDQLIASQTCSDQVRSATSQCTGTVFLVFENVRELVHTSNELAGSGPRQFSLGLDIENLGFALRWTAAEELAAQGASATQFSNSQVGSLANRLSALRFGAGGFSASARSLAPGAGLAGTSMRALGGGAGADGESIASRWSGFIDGSFGYGSRDDTTFGQGYEDAFDFDGQEVTIGVDYRLNDQVVLGVLGGYTDKAIDFDSSLSIVDARIDSDGYGLMAYAQWDKGDWYINGSVGAQWLGHDLDRRITYPSFNPLVAPIDETARSDTDSSALTATFGLGYALRHNAFTLEPYIKAEYQDIDIDSFTETGASGFDFTYGDQTVKSFETGVGLKLQYVLSAAFGVIVPYLRGEYRRELEDDARSISAEYAGVVGLTSAAVSTSFNLPTDRPDDAYYTATGGFSVVLRHGVQGFVQYAQVFDLDPFTDHVITGGVRLEF